MGNVEEIGVTNDFPKGMDTQSRWRTKTSINFADEILIGEAPIISKGFDNNYDVELTSKKSKEREVQKSYKNNLFNFLILSFFLITFLIFLFKIVSSSLLSFTSITSTLFIAGYFLFFGFSLFLISKRKTLSLKVKDEILHIKSFPLLNEKIPVNQILRCEVKVMKDKLHFALNENGNRYKQAVKDGLLLQLNDGKYIVIGSGR